MIVTVTPTVGDGTIVRWYLNESDAANPGIEPALIDLAAVKVPHPGSACCDLTQDLAGWIAQGRERVSRDRRWARVIRQRADRLRRMTTWQIATQAWDVAEPRCVALTRHYEELYQLSAARAQQAGMLRGDLDRVEAAHRWRLTSDDATGP